MRAKLMGIATFSIVVVSSCVTLLCLFSNSSEKGLFRVILPTADDVKDAVREEEFEKLEGKTDLIKEYIRVLLDNLF